MVLYNTEVQLGKGCSESSCSDLWKVQRFQIVNLKSLPECVIECVREDKRNKILRGM